MFVAFLKTAKLFWSLQNLEGLKIIIITHNKHTVFSRQRIDEAVQYYRVKKNLLFV